MGHWIRWPNKRPETEKKIIGNLNAENKVELKVLCESLTPNDIIVEYGTYYGLSALFLAENSKAYIVTVDHFKGSKEHNNWPNLKPLIPMMEETAIANLWDYRERVHIYKGLTAEFPAEDVLDTRDVKLVYVDASHETIDVSNDIAAAYHGFKSACICGDDWIWPSVRKAVETFAKSHKKEIYINVNFWKLV